MVAHRPSVADRADLVLWLEEGEVRAVGTHRELWHTAGYREVFGAGAGAGAGGSGSGAVRRPEPEEARP